MIAENPEELGYFIAEECPDCKGEGKFLVGSLVQPCTRCWESGLIAHQCREEGE